MNKVVCNVCGTSYPENASQCPICGFSRSSDSIAFSNIDQDTTYQYVKGGRFSKANVKKRNQANARNAEKSVEIENKRPQKNAEKKSSAAMIIIVVVLLLAIIAVVGYIALRFFLPNDYIFEGMDNLTLPDSSQEASPEASVPEADTTTDPTDESVSLACTSVAFAKSEIELVAVGATYNLSVTLEPADTIDQLTFSSSNESVATVSSSGVVTAVGNGSTVVTATCGAYSAECTVTCRIPVPEPEVEAITLNRKEITFDSEGQSWILYDGDIPVADIIWSSDDNNVATIEDGKVVSVGNGDTTVYGIYGDQSVTCIIHCKFDDHPGQSGNVSEAGGEAKRTYSLYNPTGYADDVTINVGEEFTLKLVDENKQEITGAEWKIGDETICSYTSSIVKGLKSGTTEITVTYEGTTYTSVVRVK